MPKNGLVETTSTHRIKFRIKGEGGMDPRLKEIIKEGLRLQDVVIPDSATFSLTKESGWEESKDILEITWTT